MSAVRSLHLEGDRLLVPATAFEHAGFRAWALSDELPEKVRVAYVAGEVFVEMSPECIESHNKVKTAITHALVQVVEEQDLGEVYSDGVLVTHVGAELSCEPDATVILWETFEAGRVRLTPKSGRDRDFVEIEGTPDLVVEVVSDSSTGKDTRRLREAYARAGIREYWLIDARGADIRFEILTLSGDEYRAPEQLGGSQHSAVLGRDFVLERTPNRAGRFRYRLTVFEE